MDSQVIRESFPQFAEAAILTARIAAFGIILALIIGLAVAAVRYFHFPVLSQLAQFYVELSRNCPLIVQLFFLYFGLPKLGIVLESEQCAIIGLAFLGGSYMAEAMRAGLEAVEEIQWQSAYSLGLSQLETLRHVTAPQALAITMPAITANMVFLIKETSVVGVVALPDLVFTAKEQIGQSYTTHEALTLLVLFYLIILLPVSVLAGLAERRLRSAVFGS